MAEKLRMLNTGPSLVAAALALAFGTAGIESVRAENFYGLSVAEESPQSAGSKRGGIPGQNALDQVFDAAEAQARSRLEKTRDPELMRRAAGKSPAAVKSYNSQNYMVNRFTDFLSTKVHGIEIFSAAFCGSVPVSRSLSRSSSKSDARFPISVSGKSIVVRAGRQYSDKS